MGSLAMLLPVVKVETELFLIGCDIRHVQLRNNQA